MDWKKEADRVQDAPWSNVGWNQPISHGHFCKQAALALSAGSKHGPWCACMPSERAGQWLWRGPPADLVTAPLWQLSLQIGRTHRRQEPPLVCRQVLSSLSQLLCRKHNNDRGRNSSVPVSVRGSATCLCTVLLAIFTDSRLLFLFLSRFPFLN